VPPGLTGSNQGGELRAVLACKEYNELNSAHRSLDRQQAVGRSAFGKPMDKGIGP
jgi:hypothetical protein